MTADRLDLDALEAHARRLDGRDGMFVPVAPADMLALVAAARNRDLHEELIGTARRHRDDALALVEGLRRACARFRVERDAAQAALARVTDEAMVDALARALFIEGVGPESAGAWDAPGEAGRQRWHNYARAVLATIRGVAGEGQEAGD